MFCTPRCVQLKFVCSYERVQKEVHTYVHMAKQKVADTVLEQYIGDRI